MPHCPSSPALPSKPISLIRSKPLPFTPLTLSQAEAQTQFESALVGYMATIGPDHASTVSIVHSLAVLLESQHRFEESKAMYERALASRERIFGPHHINCLHICCNLGNLLRNADLTEEARVYYLRALNGYEKAYGTNHAATQSVRKELGKIHQHGRFGSVFPISMRKDKSTAVGEKRAITSTESRVSCMPHFVGEKRTMTQTESLVSCIPRF